MKEPSLNPLSEQYLAALENHFEQASGSGLQAARELGRTAVSIGLDTLDLAKIHEHALEVLRLADGSSARRIDLTSNAADFFFEALIPIEETHRAALEAHAGLIQLSATLEELTLDLADAGHELQRQITGRQRAEAALSHSETTSSQLRVDSRNLERHLQKIARGILAATESERKKMSHQLNDEIAQTLLGINIRLLALKHETTANNANLAKEIEITQNLINDCVILVNRLADEFSSQHEQPAD